MLSCALVVGSCSTRPEPVAITREDPVATPVYDPALEPAEAVMALVPADATILVVTDYDELRLDLEQTSLTSESARRERRTFLRDAARTALFSDGLLRPQERRLRRKYGFTQDDVSWEARFVAPQGEGFVLAMRDDLDLAGVQRAVADGVGPLGGAQVDATRSLVTSGTSDATTDSWAADPTLVGLVGPAVTSTYVEGSCLPYDVVFPGRTAADFTPEALGDLSDVQDLGPFSVSFGSRLATVTLGTGRGDTLERAALADAVPPSDPAFDDAFIEPVIDTGDGRIGYRLGDRDAAEDLVLTRRLPFAVCSPP